MIYYEIAAKSANKVFQIGTRKKDDLASEIQDALDFFNGTLEKKRRVFVCNIHKETISFAGCLESYDAELMANMVNSFLKEMEIDCVDVSVKEVTFFRFTELLEMASKNDYICDDDDELDAIGVDDLRRFEGPDRLSEYMADEISDENKAIDASRAIVCFPELEEEIQRIFAPNDADGPKIHPVHYVIMSDYMEQRQKARNLLVGSLFLAHRLSSRRVCVLGQNLIETGGRYDRIVDSVFKSQAGASVIIQPALRTLPSGVIDNNHQQLMTLCSAEMKNHKSTLCITEIGNSDDKLLEQIRIELPSIRFVVLREKAMTVAKARNFLKKLAAEDKIAVDSGLFSHLPEKEAKLFPSELNDMYEKWLNTHICEEVYPQYKNIQFNEDSFEQEAEGSAYSRLMEMVGLSEAKTVLQNAVDFHKAQKKYSEFGLKVKTTNRHMVFTGNPGSAKTTVARLFSQILKDNGVLREGRFIEAGRHNIVDMYLGGTAPRVHRLFEQATGGVLFIDEAYSLVDGERGLYGDEAINAIVQEMENHRADVIVIFAGYPDKMKVFLDSNPGLRSRIAFHVHFKDYTSVELFRILELFSTEQQMLLAPDVRDRVMPFFDQARTHSDFGNGRFVRNLFEQAQMRQSSRLASFKLSELSKETVRTLVAEDFVLSEEYAAKERRPMGFRM